jgi:AAA+ superfamily predicted ATPase
LTTNRVESFDQAFQSRIHLSLQYDSLSEESKKGLWNAFSRKAQDSASTVRDLATEELNRISKIDMNGRQIKNTVKLASALARHDGQSVSFQHLIRALKAQGYKVEGHDCNMDVLGDHKQ